MSKVQDNQTHQPIHCRLTSKKIINSPGYAGADPWNGGTGGLVWRGGDPRPVPLIPAVAGLSAVGTLLDEDEDAEEKRRRIEAKIAAENFGAAIGFAAGAALAVKEKLDEQSAQEEQKKQQHEQTMGGL